MSKSKNVRVGISPALRFEIFKRDDFTCRYCGQKTPNVVLEVDHVVPVCDDGTNDELNLVTSCWSCNRGKSGTPLDNIIQGEDPHEKAVMMLETARQVREYNEIKKQIREGEEEDIDELLCFWDDLASEKARKFPAVSAIRQWLRKIPREDIKDAMEIAFNKAGDYRGVLYLGGILRNWANGDKD